MVSRHSPEPNTEAGKRRPLQLVGHRIRRLRKGRRLTVADLAQAAGVQPADLARLEKGEYRASLDVLFRILGVLEVNGEAFFAEMARSADPVAEGSAIREL
jgi:transcriptional regulator with XRE-family HTH domain